MTLRICLTGLPLEGDNLTLTSKKEEEKKKEGEGHLRRERYSRGFQRRFRLPEDVDVEKINAKFEKGVLTLRIPRAGTKRGKGHKIEIKSG